MENKNVSSERKFLHDIATPLATIKIMTKRLLAHVDGTRPMDSQETAANLVKNILKAIGEMENLHSDHKESLYVEETTDTKPKVG